MTDDERGGHRPEDDPADRASVADSLSAISPALAASLDCPAYRFPISLAGLVTGLGWSPGSSGSGSGSAGTLATRSGRRRGCPALGSRRSVLPRWRSLRQHISGSGEEHTEHDQTFEQARQETWSKCRAIHASRAPGKAGIGAALVVEARSRLPHCARQPHPSKMQRSQPRSAADGSGTVANGNLPFLLTGVASSDHVTEHSLCERNPITLNLSKSSQYDRWHMSRVEESCRSRYD